MRVRPVGASALLLECRDADEVEAWRTELWRRRAAGKFAAAEIVPGAASVLLDGVDPGLAERLPGWRPTGDTGRMSDMPLVEIPAIFDGQDLDDVADIWGVSVREAVDRLVSADLTVAFSGFAPGFAYLRGLPAQWAVPRLDTPRPRVPAGSIALAGGYAGIYPSASPGGWRLVGRTSVQLFDVRREPPALLGPGTRVRLVAEEPA
jgi:KipI family sensor histidine kinase inhibitor